MPTMTFLILTPVVYRFSYGTDLSSFLISPNPRTPSDIKYKPGNIRSKNIKKPV